MLDEDNSLDTDKKLCSTPKKNINENHLATTSNPPVTQGSSIAQVQFDEKWLADLYDTYRYLHEHPELSMVEHQTVEFLEGKLKEMGLKPKRVGGTGLVASIENGDGPVVGLRADIDALPVLEGDKSPRPSLNKGVMHACGHDIHMTCMLGAVDQLIKHREKWSGTVVIVFQPGEETGEGALAMVQDGIKNVVDHMDVYLGQHVWGMETGSVFVRPGAVMSAAASIEVTINGRGSHGSMPHLSVDPIVIGADAVMRLQSVVSREISPHDFAVVTVGSFQSGTKSNIIPDQAVLQINTRAFDLNVQARLHESIERIIKAQCAAAGAAEPTFRYYNTPPLTYNDPQVTKKVLESFEQVFGDKVCDMEPVEASEDFSVIASAYDAPYCFWMLGGFPAGEQAPGNHSPFFVPELEPTVSTGIRALLAAASAWVSR